jgi:hypothetical protein
MVLEATLVFLDREAMESKLRATRAAARDPRFFHAVILIYVRPTAHVQQLVGETLLLLIV